MSIEYSYLPMTVSELLGGFRPAPAAPVFFLAYDFKDTDGEKFVTDLRSALAHSPRDAPIQILDGRVDAGKAWATEVRDRITRSRVLFADLTLNSLEVYFECGLAWGLGKAFHPIVRTPERKDLLPYWLLGLQVGVYGTEEGLQRVAAQIREMADVRLPRARGRCESAVPGKIAVLTSDPITLTGQDATVRAACGQYGMTYSASPLLQATALTVEVPAHAADSSLLIVNVTGDLSDTDKFFAFCVGALLSHPSSGVDVRKLLKQVLIVVPDGAAAIVKIFPESAKRIKNVKVLHLADLPNEVYSFGQNYQAWKAAQQAPKKMEVKNAVPRRRKRT